MYSYADLSKTNHDHFLFNTGYFTVLKNLYPNDNCTLYCHQSHFEYIKNDIDKKNVIQKPAYIIPKTKNKFAFFLLWLYKNFYDFFILYKIIKENKTQKGRFVFFAMMPVRSMWYLLFWHRFFSPNTKLILTFHGEIEVWFQENKNFTQRFHCFVFRRLMTKSNDNLSFFVPNDFIKSNLYKEKLFAQKHISSIYHLLYPQINNDVVSVKTLAHIGSTELRKNSDLFFEFATKIRAQFPTLDNKISFFVAGKYKREFDNLWDKKQIVIADQSRILERNYFDQSILKSNYSVIFIYPHEYLYRESGTVLESLKFHKPIIGLSHPYFDFLEAQYGKIGIFAPTMDELITLIASTFESSNTEKQQYEVYVNNIKQMHADITLEKLSEKLRKQFATIGIL